MLLSPRLALTNCVRSITVKGGLTESRFAMHKNFEVQVGAGLLPFLFVFA